MFSSNTFTFCGIFQARCIMYTDSAQGSVDLDKGDSKTEESKVLCMMHAPAFLRK